MNTPNKINRGTGNRAIIVVVIAGCMLGLVGLWVWFHDRSLLQTGERLHEERARLDTALAKADGRIHTVAAELASEQDRAARSAKVAADLEQLKSTWDWVGVNRAQQRETADRLVRMQAMQAKASARALELGQTLARIQWERNSLEIERSRNEIQRQAEEAKKTSATYYFERAWLRVRSWLIIGAALYVLGPVMWRQIIANRARRQPVPTDVLNDSAG